MDRKYFFLLGILTFSTRIFSQATTESSGSTKKSGPSEYSFGLMLGGGIHAGETDASLVTLPIYFGQVHYQRNQGFLRPGIFFTIQEVLGETSFLGSQTSFNMLTIGGGLELLIFPLSQGKLSPFIGGQGYAQRGSLLMDNAPADYLYFSRPNIFGYELAVGFDLQSNQKTQFRVKLSYSTDILKIGTNAVVNSSSLRFSIGI